MSYREIIDGMLKDVELQAGKEEKARWSGMKSERVPSESGRDVEDELTLWFAPSKIPMIWSHNGTSTEI